MLPKRARMSASETRAVIKDGRSLREEGLSAKYRPAQAAKIAVVVSKKVASSAVERNRLRRLAYNALPSPLPQVRMVLFVQSRLIRPESVANLCSRLS